MRQISSGLIREYFKTGRALGRARWGRHSVLMELVITSLLQLPPAWTWARARDLRWNVGLTRPILRPSTPLPNGTMPQVISGYISGSISPSWEASARSTPMLLALAELIIILPHLLTCLIRDTTNTSPSIMTRALESPNCFTMEPLWLLRRSAFLPRRQAMTFISARASRVSLAL